MTKQIVVEHNTETGEISEREMTAAEIAEVAQAEQELVIEPALKQQAKLDLFTKLGLTPEEAALLLS